MMGKYRNEMGWAGILPVLNPNAVRASLSPWHTTHNASWT